MDLTSYDRLRRYVTKGSTTFADNADNKRDLVRWISAISSRIEQYINHTLEIDTYIQYFDLEYAQTQFWIKAPPITSIDSLKYDTSSQWSGTSESTLDSTEYFIGTNAETIVLLTSFSFTGLKVIQAVYIGGFAASGTRSVFAVADSDGWDVGKFIVGSLSDAKGIIKAAGSDSLTIEVLYGKFRVGETITEYDEEDETGAGATTTISSKTSEALCEAYPDITAACEGEIRFRWTHKLDYENDSSQTDGVTLRRDAGSKANLQAETRDLLAKYRRYVV